MKMKLFAQIPGMTLAVLLTLTVGSVKADGGKLEGTWDAIPRFPQETCDKCGCPGGVPVQRINEIVRGKRGISPETAWLLSQDLGTTPEFWSNL